MRRYAFAAPAVLLALASLSAAAVHAQNFRTQPCGDSHSDSSGGFVSRLFSQEQACEVRSATVPLVAGQLRVQSTNGGIEVLGEDRSDIALEARVEARAHSQADAESLVREIRVVTTGTITAEGPKSIEGRSWSVSYHLRVPRHLAAELKSQNGALKLASVEGDIRAETTNGGLSLRDLAGDVHVTTTNGGATVVLAGATWRGRGLSVQSTNGGLHIQMPGSYSAHLLAQTTNGGISGDFPSRAGGRRHNSLDTTVGQGGPTLDFGTTNGGISFNSN